MHATCLVISSREEVFARPQKWRLIANSMTRWLCMNFSVIDDQGFHPSGCLLIVLIHGTWLDGKCCCRFYCCGRPSFARDDFHISTCGVELGPRVALTPFYHAIHEGVDEGEHVHRRVVVHLTSAQVFPPFKSSDFD